MIIGTYMYMH